MAMIITLSTAMMAKGVKPISSTLRIARKSYPEKVILMGGFLPSRKASTKAQLPTWEITVATAAPVTPISST